MSLKLPDNKKFRSVVNNFFKQHSDVLLDILLFGSVVRGKEHPNDVDILLVFKDKEDLDIAYSLRKSLDKFCASVQITTRTYASLFDRNFRAREAFLGECFSLVRNEFVSKGFGYSNWMLFKYSLKGFSQSKRMRLQYALYGRSSPGIVEKLKLKKFADAVFLCPIEHSEQLKQFFDYWKISFENFTVLIPERVL